MTHSITKSLILSCFDTLRVFAVLLSRLYHGFESRTRYQKKMKDTGKWCPFLYAMKKKRCQKGMTIRLKSVGI